MHCIKDFEKQGSIGLLHEEDNLSWMYFSKSNFVFIIFKYS